MAIYRKSVVNKRLNSLEAFYLELRKALEGKEPDTLGSKAYGYEKKEDFARDCTSINYNEVLVQLEHFKAEITGIKLMKNDAISPKRDY